MLLRINLQNFHTLDSQHKGLQVLLKVENRLLRLLSLEIHRS